MRLYVVCCELRPGHIVRGHRSLPKHRAKFLAQCCAKETNLKYWIEPTR
jgi:hypothetical protein